MSAGLLAADGEKIVDTRADTGSSCAMLATDAFTALDTGETFLLVADHDPIGIFYMLQAEQNGSNSWEVLQDGPELWQVRIGRTAA